MQSAERCVRGWGQGMSDADWVQEMSVHKGCRMLVGYKRCLSSWGQGMSDAGWVQEMSVQFGTRDRDKGCR